MRDRNGKVRYVDGGKWQSSNWLRYINCARGQSEENVMVRVTAGEFYYVFSLLLIIAVTLLFSRTKENTKVLLNYNLYCCTGTVTCTLHCFCLGAVQYYTFKPVAIEKELLVFYGDEYFEEMGYEINREDPENS